MMGKPTSLTFFKEFINREISSDPLCNIPASISTISSSSFPEEFSFIPKSFLQYFEYPI